MDDNGKEYWSSRDLCNAMGYSGYWKFQNVIDKAIKVASEKGMDIDDHFNGVVHIGVAAHHHKVQLVPAACFHVCPADGQKFSVDLWGRVVHNAPFVDSIPSQSTPYGVASSPDGGSFFCIPFSLSSLICRMCLTRS